MGMSAYDEMIKKLFKGDYEWAMTISEMRKKIASYIQEGLEREYSFVIQVTPDIELHIDFCPYSSKSNEVHFHIYVYHTTYGQQRYYSLERLPVQMRLPVMRALYEFFASKKKEMDECKEAQGLARELLALVDEDVVKYILREVLKDEQQQ